MSKPNSNEEALAFRLTRAEFAELVVKCSKPTGFQVFGLTFRECAILPADVMVAVDMVRPEKTEIFRVTNSAAITREIE